MRESVCAMGKTMKISIAGKKAQKKQEHRGGGGSSSSSSSSSSSIHARLAVLNYGSEIKYISEEK